MLSFREHYLTTRKEETYVFSSKQLSDDNLWKMEHSVGNKYTFQNIATLEFLNRPNVKTAADPDPGLNTVHISAVSKRSKWELDGELEDDSIIKLKSFREDFLHSDENGIITAAWANQLDQYFEWTLRIANGIAIFKIICY